MTQLMRSKKHFLKIDNYQGFFSFSGTLVRFSRRIDDFGFDFHKLFLSGIVETN